MIPSPLLVVTDRHGCDRPLVDTVRAVLEGGARWIWFRDKDLEPSARRDLALECLACVREAGGTFTVGADPVLAAAIDADGLHASGSHRHAPHAPLGMKERAHRARIFGVSAHGLSDVRAAASDGADYVTLSPIFATASKPGYGPALGLDILREAAAAGISVVALGGVGAMEARACLDAGAAGVAVMGAVMRASDPAAETRRLLRALRAVPEPVDPPSPRSGRYVAGRD